MTQEEYEERGAMLKTGRSLFSGSRRRETGPNHPTFQEMRGDGFAKFPSEAQIMNRLLLTS